MHNSSTSYDTKIGKSAGYGGWFGVVLAFIFLRGALDLVIAIGSMTAINYLLFGLMMFVFIAAIVPGLRPHFRIIGSVIMLGRGFVNLALVTPYLHIIAEAGPALIPNMVISFILPIAAGMYIMLSRRVRATMERK